MGTQATTRASFSLGKRPMKIGDIITWQRTFTEEDIRLFGQLSGDEGIHHVQTDEQGRLMVQGLLTATLPTKIGGDLDFIAREMTFQFRRPIYAGDSVECQVTITDLKEDRGILNVSSTWKCRNQSGKEVMVGRAVDIIRT
jgi:acyl dehydratase